MKFNFFTYRRGRYPPKFVQNANLSKIQFAKVSHCENFPTTTPHNSVCSCIHYNRGKALSVHVKIHIHEGIICESFIHTHIHTQA